jgi:hypothetical protein
MHQKNMHAGVGEREQAERRGNVRSEGRLKDDKERDGKKEKEGWGVKEMGKRRVMRLKGQE